MDARWILARKVKLVIAPLYADSLGFCLGVARLDTISCAVRAPASRSYQGTRPDSQESSGTRVSDSSGCECSPPRAQRTRCQLACNCVFDSRFRLSVNLNFIGQGMVSIFRLIPRWYYTIGLAVCQQSYESVKHMADIPPGSLVPGSLVQDRIQVGGRSQPAGG